MITINLIQKTVEEYFGLFPDSIKRKTRKEHIRKARQIVQYFTSKMTHLHFTTIAIMTGCKDRTIVYHSVKVVENAIQYDKKYKIEILELEKKIKSACRIKSKDDQIAELKAIISKQRAIIKKMQKNKRKHLKIVA